MGKLRHKFSKNTYHLMTMQRGGWNHPVYQRRMKGGRFLFGPILKSALKGMAKAGVHLGKQILRETGKRAVSSAIKGVPKLVTKQISPRGLIKSVALTAARRGADVGKQEAMRMWANRKKKKKTQKGSGLYRRPGVGHRPQMRVTRKRVNIYGE